jgi:hypothetical protein
LKRLIILFTFLIVLSNFALATESTIHSFISDIKANPSDYTIVIGSLSDNKEIMSATDLASFFSITNSRFDNEVTQKNNLILIGSPDVNTLTKSLLGQWSYGEDKALIKVMGNNIVIAGSSTKNTQLGIDLVKNYEKNNDKLQINEYLMTEFFSPSNFILWTILIGVLIVIIILVVLILKLISSKRINKLQNTPSVQQTNMQQESIQQSNNPRVVDKPIQEVNQQINSQQSSDEIQIYSYIQRNLARGYQKYDLQKALLNQGWDSKLVDNVLMRFS